ncbi:MAG: acetate--CoA ligase [Caedimonadaceae bacterium]|nr:MAG: acetate--CoA ligase [Caedimonadaceae bacterium]
MSAKKIVPKEAIKKDAWIKPQDHMDLYRQSVDDPESFWKMQAQCIDWMNPFETVKRTSYDPKNFFIRWFEEGTLNVAANCLDRHLALRGNKTAILWEGDDPSEQRLYTYLELYEEVCRFANVLRSLGVNKGDRVTIYMPQIPEAIVAMLAVVRIGAIHSTVFGGFSPESLSGRIADCASSIVITADEGKRGGKTIPLKFNVDKALDMLGNHDVSHVIVVKRTGGAVSMQEGRDQYYDVLMRTALPQCLPEEMQSEDPLFILYTSGSTGNPKGVLHTTGGYLVYASMTHRLIFDYHDEDIYWCTADIGWITGHTYNVYGPLCNGATIVLFEGVPTYPSASRLWEIVERYQVSILYTAPTVIRALMSEGEKPVQKTNRNSLRILGTVGEPINPEAWEWYYHVVGEERCPIVDTWWQTETGGILITPLPGATTLKPGSATLPFFGVRPALVDNNGEILEGVAEGNLVLLDSWPGQMRGVYGDSERFINTYFKTFPGKYFTGDGARRDEDGYYWITGRIDDVINVSGHRLGTAEIEAALGKHHAVAESAVVGFPHPIKGQGIYAFVMLLKEQSPSDLLKGELIQEVQKHIGALAKPDHIQWVSNLPRTRSGKIMRRILRKIVTDEIETIGDTSTLADPSIVQEIIENYKKQ